MRSSYREFIRQLIISLEGGLPIKESLASISSARRPGRIAVAVLEWLESGSTLGEALKSCPDVPAEHAALMQAGDESGQLVEIVRQIERDFDAELEIQRTLLQQMAYPVIVLCLGLLLPPLAILFATGNYIPYFWFFIGSFLALAALSALVLVGPRLLPTEGDRRLTVERWIFRMPLIAWLVRTRMLSRILALEGRLLEAGLSLDHSLSLVRETIPWLTLRQQIDDMIRGLERGRNAGEVFAKLPISAEIAGRLSAAEVAGRLSQSLEQIAAEMRTSYVHRLRVSLRVLPVLVYLLTMFVILKIGTQVLTGQGFEGLGQ